MYLHILDHKKFNHILFLWIGKSILDPKDRFSHDKAHLICVVGVEARAILVQTGVPQQLLAQIW